MKLDLGCGAYCRAGYEGVDTLEHPGVKHNINLVTEKLPFEDNSVEAISSSHFLEHVTDEQAYEILKEATRVLKIDGTIELVVPNFPRLLELFLEAEYQDRWTWWVRTIFGNQEEGEPDFHRTGWDTDKMWHLLELLGYVGISCEEVWTHSQPCLRFEGRKSNAPIVRPTD